MTAALIRTLSDALVRRAAIHVRCKVCGHSACMGPDRLIQRFDPFLLIIDLPFRCAVCGSVDVAAFAAMNGSRVGRAQRRGDRPPLRPAVATDRPGG